MVSKSTKKEFSYQFHASPNGTPHFRGEALNGITFNALANAGEADARIKSRVEQFTAGKPEQFFDLRIDPDERVNLVADPKHAAEITRLKQLLLAHMEKTADPQLESFRKVLK